MKEGGELEYGAILFPYIFSSSFYMIFRSLTNPSFLPYHFFPWRSFNKLQGWRLAIFLHDKYSIFSSIKKGYYTNGVYKSEL